MIADARAEREAPRGVHAPAVGREHTQAPVADLVAEALDHDRAVRRDHPRRLLLAQVGEKVVRRALVQVVALHEVPRLEVQRGARELADRAAQRGTAAEALAAPERHARRLARRGRAHDHAVTLDVAAMRHAEVPSTNTSPARDSCTNSSSRSPRRAARPPARRGSSRGRGWSPGARSHAARVPGSGPSRSCAGGPSRGAARWRIAQERVVEAAREHVDDRWRSQLPGERAVRPGAPEVLVELAQRHRIRRRRRPRRDLLREHVEAVLGHRAPARARRSRMPARDRRALDQIRAERADDAALGGRADEVARRGRRAGSPRATDLGEPSWTTRSIAPMSMPSSSEPVATSTGSSPDLSRSSTTRRRSRDSAPWCAWAIAAGARLAVPARSGAPPAARRRGGRSRR